MKLALGAVAILASSPVFGQASCDLSWNGNVWGCVSPTFHVSLFDGATAGDKIANCVRSLPLQGGTCDARDLPSGGTIPAFTITNSGATILGPCGAFTVTGSITFHHTGASLSACNWVGCGASFEFAVGTQFAWVGNTTDPMFDLKGVRDCVLKDFSIKSDSSATLAEGIRLETAQGAVSTNRRLENLKIFSVRAGGLKKGIRWCTGFDCSDGVIIGNNDLDHIVDVVVSNYDNCAYSIEGTQSKSHQFDHSMFAGQVQSQRGVCTTQGADPSTNAGSFIWRGPGGGSNAFADFDLGAPTDMIIIEDFNLESSARLLQTNAAGSSQWPIVIRNGRWAANNLIPDNNVVIYGYRGPLRVESLIVELPNGTVRSPQFTIASSGSPALGVAIGNSIQWTTADGTSSPFIGTWTTLGNMIRDAGNIGYAIANKVQ
jgi:hypothetical protein